MEIRASVVSSGTDHHTAVSTDGRQSSLTISAKPNGAGSSINGGELLCLALATCYCNDLYREAPKLGITLRGVRVDVVSEFGGPGEPARRITYSARVDSDASPEAIAELMRHTDRVAEVHNTLRGGIEVRLGTTSI